MEPYQELEHTADVGLTIYGGTLIELFLNAVKGLFHLISPSLIVCEKPPTFPFVKRPTVIELKAVTEEELLVYWLNEFIYYFFVKDMFPKIIEIDNLEGGEIRARVNFSKPRTFKKVRDKHIKAIQIATEIKAATYHQLSIKRKDSEYQAQVIFDV